MPSFQRIPYAVEDCVFVDERVGMISELTGYNSEFIRSVCNMYRDLSIESIIEIINTDDMFK
jgi:hypothetical protein